MISAPPFKFLDRFLVLCLWLGCFDLALCLRGWVDMIAISDFASGAMENSGLVTYRETTLLYDDRHSVVANKQRVAIVVVHELAHQWFGNLVTMKWWTHLWLNEGFATWVSYLATDSLFTEWNIWTQFLDQYPSPVELERLRVQIVWEIDSYPVWPSIYPIQIVNGSGPTGELSYGAISHIEIAPAPCE